MKTKPYKLPPPPQHRKTKPIPQKVFTHADQLAIIPSRWTAKKDKLARKALQLHNTPLKGHLKWELRNLGIRQNYD